MVRDTVRNILGIKVLRYQNYGGEVGLNCLNLDIFTHITEAREVGL